MPDLMYLITFGSAAIWGLVVYQVYWTLIERYMPMRSSAEFRGLIIIGVIWMVIASFVSYVIVLDREGTTTRALIAALCTFAAGPSRMLAQSRANRV